MTADSETHERTSGAPTGIARCSAHDADEAPYRVHGVAIGANDVTVGEHGQKLWPADELRRSASTLVGVPLTKNHDDERVESVIGEVVDVGYSDGVGIVYEAEVDDEEIAEKIQRGRLEVSIHAVHAVGGHTDDGAMIVENIRFLDLSVVPRGAAPSNSVKSGESPAEALASLSTDDVAEMLEDDERYDAQNADGGQSTRTGSTTDFDSNMTDTETDSLDEAPEVDADEAELNEEAAEASEVEEAELDDGTDVEAGADPEAEAELTEADEADVESATQETELQEDIAELRAENEELRQELESVRMEYAERLADDGPFTASELAETFAFDTLKEKFEAEEASLAQSEAQASTQDDVPAPQTGDTSSEEELSTTSEDNEAEIASLEEKVAKYDDLGWDNARAEVEAELAELRE
ncbi:MULTISPECIES: hypothetical protein [Haloarcula]|uniref:hypothetical protein n=1 Tax=Haloarcula TaxID=2237 RepID=UPI000F8D4AEF|nr:MULTISPECIES: hypothetical protein [Haloarcula]NHX41391.1 hypothetical protein [Haloarcula sp. R1-2]